MLNDLTIKKEKQWILREKLTAADEAKVADISASLGINPIVAKLLYTRGCKSVESAKSFIYMESEMLANPFDMKDMRQGIMRVHTAIKNGEKITVYGDYDVDGVTSVCTLYLYLKEQGANIDYYIPNRTGEGYGVSTAALDALRESGTSLVITVDTGTTANEEIQYAKSIGIDFVVTDHHECRIDLPEAAAVINPHRPDCDYPFKELAGVGVVFKFVCAYEEVYCGTNRYKAAARIFSKFADLVAIGTIADVMPIKSENRIIVAYGLKMLENTDRLGLIALMDATNQRSDAQRDKKRKKIKVTSGYVGYTLAPRINAAGRIKTASLAVELFLADSEEKARNIAEELCAANKERQAEENSIMQDAYKKIEEADINNNPVIVLDADDWHHGVIGIVSSRITEKYSRPSILISFEGNDPETPSGECVGKGSGRSIKGMNLVDALCHCDDLLLKYGGHELAAGLSVSRANLEAFKKKINDYARTNLSEEDMIPTLDTDLEIDFDDINLALAEGLRILEPYGVDNHVPVFVTRGVTVNEISGVSDGKHTKLVLGNGKKNLFAICFSVSPEEFSIGVGERADVLFTLDVNEWGGRRCVQVIVRDVKPTNGVRCEYKDKRERFEEIKAGAKFTKEEGILPTRDDFASVYKLLLASQHAGVNVLSHRDICAKLSCASSDKRINYAKLKIIVMVMRELNIISIDEIDDEVYKFSIHYTTTKTDLDKSGILRKLRSQQITQE